MRKWMRAVDDAAEQVRDALLFALLIGGAAVGGYGISAGWWSEYLANRRAMRVEQAAELVQVRQDLEISRRLAAAGAGRAASTLVTCRRAIEYRHAALVRMEQLLKLNGMGSKVDDDPGRQDARQPGAGS